MGARRDKSITTCSSRTRLLDLFMLQGIKMFFIQIRMRQLAAVRLARPTLFLLFHDPLEMHPKVRKYWEDQDRSWVAAHPILSASWQQ